MAQSGPKKPLTCPLCQAADPHLFYHENNYNYWQCHACKLLFLWPAPDSPFLHDHYQEYLSIDNQEVVAWGEEMQPVINNTADSLDDLFPEKGRVLDIGCGYGFFLKEMQQRGWQIEGVELSKPAAAIARQQTGALIHSTGVEEMKIDKQFDVITMFYVIEHVADPVTILQSVRQLLAPGGILVLRYPNTSPLFRLHRGIARKLRLMQAPSHLYDYHGTSMPLLLKKAGFQSYRITINTNTAPANIAKRFISCYIGLFGILLSHWSNDRILLPGFSRTAYASVQSGFFPQT